MTSLNDSAHDVIVVGAGPTGLALAASLGQEGVRVLVVDRHPGVYPLPRAVHLDDEVYRILHALGVGPAFAAITHPTLGLRLVDERHRTIAQFERASVTPSGLPQANMYDQPDLERILRERCAQLPSVELRGGVDVTAIEQDADGVVARLADGPSLRGRYLVGCDGANSLVARTIGSDPEPLGFEQRWLVLDARCARPCGGAWEGVDQQCDPRRAGTFMRVAPGRYRWEFQLLPGEASTDYADVARLRPLIGPWVEGIADEEIEVFRIAEYTFRAAVARRWRDRRVLIAGDAAHLTPPFIGQGLCAGVRDAANLGWKLAWACRSGSSGPHPTGHPGDLLDTYEVERRPHAREMVRRAVTIGRAMTDGGLVGLLRRWLVPLLFRVVPSLAEHVLDSVTPPLSGPLVDGRLPRSVRGRLLPLVRMPGEVLVDELLGREFGVVALPGADVDEVARRLGARVVRVDPGATHPGPAALAAWLARARADHVVVRPDRTVLAAGRSGARTPELSGRLGS